MATPELSPRFDDEEGVGQCQEMDRVFHLPPEEAPDEEKPAADQLGMAPPVLSGSNGAESQNGSAPPTILATRSRIPLETGPKPLNSVPHVTAAAVKSP
ncbi:hypothetical protein AAFF_G00283400 [Aldrovandia affinis]|uniref:Uncharacterized protein n=1 Tax=Aldrovandia affinis TaxID=143900 RepID=A0AAD7TAD7_9TELE|nr:hypothetical protein AAFF_G00283400 [Aldrovandia affinis]